jgi:prevent-host-death family protein
MDVDHGTIATVEEIAISKFKATCLAVLERVRRTRQPVVVTRFGRPIAEVVPPALPARGKRWLGAMEGTGEILGDVVAPAAGTAEWEAES